MMLPIRSPGTAAPSGALRFSIRIRCLLVVFSALSGQNFPPSYRNWQGLPTRKTDAGAGSRPPGTDRRAAAVGIGTEYGAAAVEPLAARCSRRRSDTSDAPHSRQGVLRKLMQSELTQSGDARGMCWTPKEGPAIGCGLVRGLLVDV